jgi:hypothetical protein
MESWRAIIAKAVEQARDGDAKARKWLSNHLVGKPTGDALFKLAAAELAGYDPVEDQASDLHQQKTWLDLFSNLKSRQEP